MTYLLIILFLLFGLISYDVNKSSGGEKLYYIIAFLLLVAMSAFRYRVGGDTLLYEDKYASWPNLSNLGIYLTNDNDLGYQPLWFILVAFCKTISPEFYFFQFVHALIFNLSLFVFLKRYTPYKFTVLLVMFLSLLYFYYSFEIQRETLALSVFLFNIRNLENKKYVRYYFLASISLLFHISAFFLFFLPLFNLFKIKNKTIILLLVMSVILLFFRSLIFTILMPLLFLESMKNRAEIYSQINLSLLGFIAFYIVRVILILPLMIYRNSLATRKYEWFYSSFLLVSILAQYFTGFERLLNFLYPVYLVIVVDVIYNNYALLKLKTQKNFVVFFALINLFFILDYKLYIKNSYGQNYYSLFFPYETIFNPVIHADRESFYYSQWN